MRKKKIHVFPSIFCHKILDRMMFKILIKLCFLNITGLAGGRNRYVVSLVGNLPEHDHQNHFYDSAWQQTTEVAGAVIGASIGAAVSGLMVNPGLVVAVTVAGITGGLVYYICKSISPTPTRTLEENVRTVKRNITTDYDIKFKIIE